MEIRIIKLVKNGSKRWMKYKKDKKDNKDKKDKKQTKLDSYINSKKINPVIMISNMIRDHNDINKINLEKLFLN